MTELKVGDKITRLIEGFRGRIWEYDGVITEILPHQIVGKFFTEAGHDTTMRFNIETGVNILGIEYGWIFEVDET